MSITGDGGDGGRKPGKGDGWWGPEQEDVEDEESEEEALEEQAQSYYASVDLRPCKSCGRFAYLGRKRCANIKCVAALAFMTTIF